MTAETRINRRRYGNRTFSWVLVKVGSEWVEAPLDPYPAVNPPKSYIAEAIAAAQVSS